MAERDIKLAIKKLLDKLGIDSWRMQAGGYRGRTRGLPKGTPDLLAAPVIRHSINAYHAGLLVAAQSQTADIKGIEGDIAFELPAYLWIETKTPDGKPSKEQLEFADEKRKKGHFWIIARSEQDVLDWIKEHRAR